MGHSDTGETRVPGQGEATDHLPLPQRPSRYTRYQHWLPVLRKIIIALFGGGALAALGAMSIEPNDRELHARSFARAQTHAGIAPGTEWLAPVKEAVSSGAHRSANGSDNSNSGQPPSTATCACPEHRAVPARSSGAVGQVASAPEGLSTRTGGSSAASAPPASPVIPSVSVPATSSGPHEGGGPTVLPDGRVVLNVATLSDLVTLPGIGPKRATQILELRTRLGKFRKLSDLLRVKGIGVKSLRKLTPRLVVDHPP